MADNFKRESAIRAFTQELRQITEKKRADEGEYTPTFYPLPTGIDANRVLIMGVLIETEDIGTDAPYMRGRITDPTGSIMLYAGEYQPEAAQFLEEAETPCYIAVVGKPKIYTPESGVTMASLNPESITEVESTQVDMWVQETVRATLYRLDEMEDSPEKSAYKDMCAAALEKL